MLFRSVPQLNYFILILEVYGPTINPLLSLLALLWACRDPFLLFSHHTLPMGLLFAISLLLGSFEPIRFLKAHLLILWTFDPLLLLLELNGFCSLSFANFFSVCVAGLGFLSFIRVPQKDPQRRVMTFQYAPFGIPNLKGHDILIDIFWYIYYNISCI